MRFVVLGALLICPMFVFAQKPTSVHVSILNLAKPSELDFSSASCDQASEKMSCVFQQVLLHTAAGSDTCSIVTNRYQMNFDRQTATRWVSNDGLKGSCGVVEITTLEEDGTPGVGVLWQMTSQKVITNPNASDFCKSLAAVERPEVLTWKDPKRALPCKFVIPAMLP